VKLQLFIAQTGETIDICDFIKKMRDIHMN